MKTAWLSTLSKVKNTHPGKLLLLPLLLLSLAACQVQVSDDNTDSDEQTSSQDDDKKKDDKQSDTAKADDSDKQELAGKDKAKKDDEKEKPAIPVEVVRIGRGDIQQTYRAITTLEAENAAEVVARSTGILQDIFVEEGDFVEKGQLLAQLDIEQLSLEVTRLKATTSKLKKEKERQESLFERKLTSRDALDRASYEYKAQQAQLSLSELKLDYASIKAPIGGIITERLVKKGNLIRENELVYKIVDLQSLKAVLYLPESELSNIRQGQPVWLSVPAIGDTPVQGKIERIRPTVDTATGTFRVIASVNNSDRQLKTGMFGKVEVVFDEHKDSLLLQQNAVISQDNRTHVFVIRDSKAVQTPVITGFKRDGVIEITSGLEDSDLVVTTGQQILKHDSKVEIVNKETVEAVATNQTSNATNKPSVASRD